MRAAFLSVFLLLLPAVADSQAATVQQALEGCRLVKAPSQATTPKLMFAMGECLGLLRGVYQTMRFNADFLNSVNVAVIEKIFAANLEPKTILDVDNLLKGSRLFLGACNREEITTSQLAQMFLNWADENPKAWQSDVFTGISDALRAAYKC
ncbi:MAG: Rap1a/Tai family immunity protein [Alphaproteobacteria bacterium]|nr:Rap1a/Tai family immunity protein [Alphaproteobacteria bacterium]